MAKLTPRQRDILAFIRDHTPFYGEWIGGNGSPEQVTHFRLAGDRARRSIRRDEWPAIRALLDECTFEDMQAGQGFFKLNAAGRAALREASHADR